jgi:tetratricopeptide (TPR) repeat protein
MTHISKHDLKKNELDDFLVMCTGWIKNNLNLFYGICAAIAVAILALIFIQYRISSLNASSADKLAAAQNMLYQGQTQQGLGILDELISNYGTSETACKARMTKADFLMASSKFSDAEQVLLPVAQNGKPKTIMPLALSVLGAAQENQGKLADAAKTYNSFLSEFPDHFFAPKIYESLARVYELSGTPGEARGVYEKIVTLYPSTLWAQRAQERLAFIQAQNPRQSAPGGQLPNVIQNPEQSAPK